MKRGRRKCGNKDKVFGCDLTEHLATTNQEIPQVLRSCSEFIEEHGVVDGIYRLSGVSSNTQKLRSEFDTEGTPDLYKDLYLQDIHCVSSLCKAYFRELPNPLLTYQLYDHFAEAVAVQLEDERMVKIKEVLKELPAPHYRTLEYLMRHLVRMSTYSSQTNMHARNLAIVWAPNLLRSKDIEASGFNGTAAFMEVRVQSIVVEFILTHVPQLFPDLDSESGWTRERRKSLPSPTSQLGQTDFFKAVPFQCPGNMSPGDGPLPMKPYHAIIDGTDKRKGSLKGRKWKSIFNLGGRLQDPRKKNKYAPKEKDQNSLRPAKSMDSLSSGPFTQEESRHPGPHLSPVSVPPVTTDEAPGKAGLSGGYAVTYRRPGGASVSVVSGGTGAQGTYKSLDTGGAPGGDRSPAVSHGAASKAERRAGMHITGPFSVTVPLHITSGLILKVLQGKVDEEQLTQAVRQEKEEDREPGVGGVQETAGGKTEDLNELKSDRMDNPNEEDVKKEDEKETAEEDSPEERKETREEDRDEEFLSEEECKDERHDLPYRPSLSDGDYMVMRPIEPPCPTEARGHDEDLSPLSLDASCSEHELPLDFQDTFGFLDLMDMSASNQVNEFSVEPPAFEDEDEEEDEQSPSQHLPALQTHLDEGRPGLALPTHSERLRAGKSHSLPYRSSPFLPIPCFSSDEDDYSGPDEDDGSESDKSVYEDMFFKSLPSLSHFQALSALPTLTLTTTGQSDVSNPAPTSDLLQDIRGLTPVEPSGISENRVVEDVHDPCPDEENLSSLSLDAECLDVGEKNPDAMSGDEREPDEACHVEVPQEEDEESETTDSRDDTLCCSQEQSQCINTESWGSTCLCADATFAFLELANIDISCHSGIEPFIREEETIPDSRDYLESPEGRFDMAEADATLMNGTDSVSVDVCDRVQPDAEVECIVVEEGHMGDSGEVLCRQEKEDIRDGGQGEIGDEQDHEEAPTEKNQEHEEQCEGGDSDHGVVIDDQGEKTDAVNHDGIPEVQAGAVHEEDARSDDEFNSEGKATEDRPADPVMPDPEEPMKSHSVEELEKDDAVDLGPGVERTVIRSKPKIYHVKAVPVVPPKPQHSKITAFKQQFQQSDTKQQAARRDDKDRVIHPKRDQENNTRDEMADAQQPHQDKATPVKKRLKDAQMANSADEEQSNDGDPKQRRVTWDGGSPRKDMAREGDRETKKVGTISICFDQAVARATGKLCREKELLEKDRLLDLQVERFEPKEALKPRQRDEDERN